MEPNNKKTNMSEVQMESNLTLNEELELIERVKQGNKEAETELMNVNVRWFRQ